MNELERLPPGPRCHMGVFLENSPTTPRRRLNALLENPEVPHAGIHRLLVSWVGDWAPSLWSISNHRRGKCRCNKKG